MKVLKNITLLFCIIFLFNCKSDDDTQTQQEQVYNFLGEVESVKVYGGSKNEKAYSVTQTPDNGYAVLGYTQSIDGDITDKSTEDFDYWVIKFDSENNVEWSKTYGGSLDDRGNAIITTADGGFAILGYSNSTDQDVSQNNGLKDYWLAKLDASGNMVWEKSFGYSGADIGYTLLQTSDGGYFVTGILDVTASGGEGNTKNKHAGGDYWALKLDANGNIIWSKYYGGSNTETPDDAIETSDNNFIIVGTSDSDDVDITNNKGSYDFWVVKISNTGTLIWEKSFGGTEIDEARGIVETDDGNYIIAGDTRSLDLDVTQNHGAADLWFLKISTNGDILYQKSIGGTSFDVSRSISKGQDNSFIIAGSSRSADGDLTVNQGQNDAWILKVDQNANILWQKTIGGLNVDYAYNAIELDNKNIVAVGESTSSDGDIPENKGFTDALIIKIK